MSLTRVRRETNAACKNIAIILNGYRLGKYALNIMNYDISIISKCQKEYDTNISKFSLNPLYFMTSHAY